MCSSDLMCVMDSQCECICEWMSCSYSRTVSCYYYVSTMNSIYPWRILRDSLRSVRSLRTIHSTRLLRDTKVPAEGESTPKSTTTDHKLGTFHHKVSEFDKKILLLTNRYKTKEDIPKFVADDIMQTAMSKARIHVANMMMVFVIGLCIYTITTAKKEAKEELDKLEQTRVDYREAITEEYRQQLAAKKSE